MTKNCIIYPTSVTQLINNYKEYESYIKASYIYLSTENSNDFSLNELINEINNDLKEEDLEEIKLPLINEITTFENSIAINAFSFLILKNLYKNFENFNFPNLDDTINDDYINNLLDEFINLLDQGDNEIIKANRKLLKESILKDRDAFKFRALSTIKDLRLLDINIDEERDQVTLEAGKDKTQDIKNDLGVSINDKVSTKIKLAILLTSYSQDILFGFSYPNNYKLIQQYIANLLSNLNTLEEMAIKLSEVNNPLINPFKNYLNLNKPASTIEEVNFRLSFFKAFNNNKKNFFQINYQNTQQDTNINIVYQSELGLSNSKKQKWINNFIRKYNGIRFTKTLVEDINKLFKSKKENKEKSLELFKLLGIELNENTINIINNDDYLDKKEEIYHLEAYYVSNFSYSNFISVFERVYKDIFENNKNDEDISNIVSVFENKSPITYYINEIANHQIIYETAIAEQSILNGNGDRVYGLQLNDFISNFFNKINYTLKRVFNYENNYKNSELEKIIPELNPNLSKVFNLFVFNQLKGTKLKEIKILNSSELVNLNNPSESISLNRQKLPDLILNYFKSISFGHFPIPRAADRAYDTFISFVNKNGSNAMPISYSSNIEEMKNLFKEEMINILKYELYTRAKYLEIKKSGIQIRYSEESKGLEDLRFFKNLDQKVKDKLFNININDVENINLKIYPEINDFLNSLIKEIFEDQKLLFTNNGLIKENKFLVSNLYKNASVDSTIYYLSLNNAIMQAEFFPLIFGDVAQFKNTEDIIKRIKLYNSTRQNVETSKLFDYLDIIDNKTNFQIEYKKEQININLPKYESPRNKRYIGQINYSRDHVLSVITKDNIISLSDEEIDKIENNILEYIANISETTIDKLNSKVKTYVKNQAQLYKEINTTDAFALVTLDFYRDLKYLSSIWKNEDEISFRLQNKENLTEREKELIKLGSFEILKTQGLGKLLNTELIDLKVISGYKHAIMPLVPQFIKGTILEEINNKLVEEGIDIVQTESANKFGTILFDKELLDFPNLENIKDLSKNKAQITSISDFGIQQDTTPKPEDFVTAAKQFRAIVLNNLYKNGELINKDNKEKIDNYENSQRQLTDFLVAEVLDEMGIGDEIDINKFTSFIKNRAQINDTNFLESLEQIKKGLPLEAIQNLGKVLSQILAEPRKATVNQKVPGMTGILASSTAFKVTEKEIDSKLKKIRIENGRVLPGEIQITLPKAFDSVLRLKYNNNLDELNKAIEESVNKWYKDPNAKTEIPIELLQIIGFRIPNQAFSSNEYLIVTKFLPRNSGGIAFLYEEITLKTGSDFDVDKLTMYLAKFTYNELGFKILKGDINTIDKLYIYELLSEEYELNDIKFEKFKKDYAKRFAEELGYNYESFSQEEINNIAKNSGLVAKDVIDINKRLFGKETEIINKIKKYHLYNNLFFAQLDLLTLPEQFGNFFNPVSDTLLKTAVKSLGKENPKFKYTDLLKASHHIKLTLEFLEGKNLLGVVANSIRNHILTQKANVMGVNKLNNSLPLFLFKHNTISKEIVKGKVANLTSYSDVTTQNGFPILSLLSEFLSAYVDIAKDSYIFRLNMTSVVINQVIAMLRAGINMGTTLEFMNQPIIDEYLKMVSFNESEFAKINYLDIDNKELIKEVFRKQGFSNYYKNSLYYHYITEDSKKFTETYIKYQNIMSNTNDFFNKKSDKQIQSIIFDIFLYHNQVSKPISNLSRIFKDDSIAFKSIDEIYNQEAEFSKLIESGDLINLENLKYDSILSSFVSNNSIIKQKLSDFYLVFSTEYYNLFNATLNVFKEKKGADLQRISRIIKDRLFDYIIQNYYTKVFPDDSLPINRDSKNALFSKELGLYKEILEITNNESTNPLKNNLVLNSFLIEDRLVTINLKQQNNNGVEANKQLYIDSFAEIIKTNPDLADKIFKFAMLQSGKVNSNFNFIDIIPANMYYDKVVRIMDYFLQSKEMLDSANLVELIAKTHPEFLPSLKRTSLVYLQDTGKYEYLKDSNNFIKFIDKYADKYPEIKNYIDNYKGFIKKLKQLNITVDNKLLVINPIKKSNYKITDEEVRVGYATVKQPVYNEKYTKIYKELQQLREEEGENLEKIKQLEEAMKSATILNFSYKIFKAVYNYTKSTEKESIYDFIEISNNSDGRYFVDMSVDNLSTSVVKKKEELIPTQPTVQSGEEISSNAKGLAAALTNPTELAKSKGNLTQSYPVEFRGKPYKDAEAAYQALKNTATKDEGPNNTYNLMVDIIKTKLEQHPKLVSEITKKGGSAWILASTHQPTKQNSVWETGGKNWFIKALNEAYISLQTTTQPTVQKTELPKEKVLEPGRYVKFNGQDFIVIKQNANGTWLIYNPTLEGVNAKKSVSAVNMKISDVKANIVTYRDAEYIVTPKNTIISLTTNKRMEWNENNGDRKAILALTQAQPIVQPTEYQLSKDDNDIIKLKEFYSALTVDQQFKLGLLDELELEYLNKFDRDINKFIDELNCKL